MRATLEFDLDNLEDKKAHLRCVKSESLTDAIWQISTNSRKSLQMEIENRIEFKGEDISPYDAINIVFERIEEILEGNEIAIDNLI